MNDEPTSPAPLPASPPAAIDVVLRKDPERRATTGLGLGRGLALLAMLASLLPAIVVALALWPMNAPSDQRPPDELRKDAAPANTAVDFVAIRAALAARAAPPASAATTATPTPTTASLATPPAPLAFDPARVEKARGLTKRVFKARDARRAAGASLPELRKPFTVVELGGNAALDEAGIAAGKRLLLSRPDGKIVAPVGAAAPEGVDLSSKERDEDLLETDATLGGKPVHIMRRCLAGELLCLVDIEESAAPARSVASVAPATPGEAATPSASVDADGALLALLDAEERKARSAVVPPLASTRASPWAGAGIGVLLALLLGTALAARLARVGSLVTSAAHRVRALAAGRSGAAPAAGPVELAALHAAIDECAGALGDARARADAEDARRQRLAALGAALHAAREHSAERVVAADDDDASTAAVVAAANALLESFEARVIRCQSHLDVVEGASELGRLAAVEARAQALAGVPPLLVDVAQRLLRLARMPELAPKAKDELNAVGEALAARGRTAQALVDQLLLDAASARPSDAPQAALASLRQELHGLSAHVPVHTTLAALRDLPIAELAQRVSSSSEP